MIIGFVLHFICNFWKILSIDFWRIFFLENFGRGLVSEEYIGDIVSRKFLENFRCWSAAGRSFMR